jgi:hypothetical protein
METHQSLALASAAIPAHADESAAISELNAREREAVHRMFRDLRAACGAASYRHASVPHP